MLKYALFNEFDFLSKFYIFVLQVKFLRLKENFEWL